MCILIIKFSECRISQSMVGIDPHERMFGKPKPYIVNSGIGIYDILNCCTMNTSRHRLARIRYKPGFASPVETVPGRIDGEIFRRYNTEFKSHGHSDSSRMSKFKYLTHKLMGIFIMCFLA